MAAPIPRLVLYRSRDDADASPAPALRMVDLATWLTALHDPASRLELVAERPAYWEFAGAWASGWRNLGFHLLYLVVQGPGALWLGDAPPERLATGTAFWLPPQTRYRMEQQDGRIYFLRFRLIAGERSLVCAAPRIHHGSLHLLPLFQQISDDLRFGHPWVAERLRAVLALLATDGRAAAGSDDEAGQLTPAQRRRLGQLVEERWRASLAPGDLARALGLSPTAFARAFRRSFDCPPRRWLADQRLHHVAQLLLTDQRPVEAVALDAGYANPSQFARRFRSVFGIAPGAYRRRQGL